jgi:hypothetical protein
MPATGQALPAGEGAAGQVLPTRREEATRMTAVLIDIQPGQPAPIGRDRVHRRPRGIRHRRGTRLW